MKQLLFYLSFPFVRYALVVGILVALCSSLLGVTLVLKRFSFIGDGLSHVAFGAMAVASVLHLASDTILIMPVTILTAILLLRTGQNTRIKGDAMIAVMSVGALAVGYMLMNVFSTSANVSGDVCTTLFGSTSILTLKQSEVWICVVFSLLVIITFLLFYHRIFAVTFDENFARATGVGAQKYNLMIAVLIAVVIVIGMNLVGSLLISALIIFPALSAMSLIRNFKGVVVASAILSVSCALVGMLVSILASTPVGSTIVVADLLVFVVCTVLSRVLKRG